MKTKIFLSWSGVRSNLLATALKALLVDIFPAANPWMSSQDLLAGDRWQQQIGQELESTSVGVVCLTPENLLAPWLHFEAGALSKSSGTSRVCTYLFQTEPRHLTGPLTQFQACQCSKEGTFSLVRTLNLALAEDARLPDARLIKTFETRWRQFEKDLHSIPEQDPDRFVRLSNQAANLDKLFDLGGAVEAARAEAIRRNFYFAEGQLAIIAASQSTREIVAPELDQQKKLSTHFPFCTGFGQLFALQHLLPCLTLAYPDRDVEVFLDKHVVPEDYAGRLRDYNLIVLGGSPTNQHTQLLLADIVNLPVDYRPDEFSFSSFSTVSPKDDNINNASAFRPFAPELDRDRVVKDYGLIVWTWRHRPSNANRRVLLLIGGTTYGTEAAAKSVTDPKILRQFSGDDNFACVIQADVNPVTHRTEKPRIAYGQGFKSC